MSNRRFLLAGFLLLFALGTLMGAQPIPNWQAPPSWTPPRAAGLRPLAVESDISGPLPFIPITPCRQYDSRSASPLPDNTTRSVTLSGVPCGIALPFNAAVSVNITVFNISGALGNGVFRVGIVSPPPTAWINFPPTETQRANAGIVTTTAGAITVQVNMGAGQLDFTVDVNGYYSSQPASGGTFTILNNQAFGVIQGRNDSSICVGDCGINGVILSTSGGYAILGDAFGASGANYGVVGRTDSPSVGGGGVLGLGFGTVVVPTAYQVAGVRGESRTGYGVLGISRSIGVGAALVDSGGSQIAYALLAAAGPTNYAVYGGGNFGGTGTKYFVEPHPTDPSQVIRYVSLEGPEAGTYFRGRGKFDHGQTTIQVPEDFRMVTDSEGLSIQVTPIGDFANVAIVRIDLDGIVVKASRNVDFFYTVNGVRKTHKDLKPIGPGDEFVPAGADATMPAYLTEGQKAMLISNGTYREDGTVNLETARRLGWEKTWETRGASTSPH